MGKCHLVTMNIEIYEEMVENAAIDTVIPEAETEFGQNRKHLGYHAISLPGTETRGVC